MRRAARQVPTGVLRVKTFWGSDTRTTWLQPERRRLASDAHGEARLAALKEKALQPVVAEVRRSSVDSKWSPQPRIGQRADRERRTRWRRLKSPDFSRASRYKPERNAAPMRTTPAPKSDASRTLPRRDDSARDGIAARRREGLLTVRVYSMTSSARTSSVCGIVRPSAFAVLRLITNSNFVGRSIGRSAGFAPLSTRST